MKPDTTEARRLADELAADVASLLREGLPQEALRADAAQSAIRALADDRDSLRAILDRAIKASEEHFGEDAIRYKLSLFKNGRASNHFPAEFNGKWFALQRADNDAHIGLALRVTEAEAERDELRAEVAVLQMACSRWESALEHGADRIRNSENERDSLRAQVEALRADAERWQALRHVFHVDEHIGKKTCMPVTKLKTHWAGWVAGTHHSAESWADACIEEAARRSQEAAG